VVGHLQRFSDLRSLPEIPIKIGAREHHDQRLFGMFLVESADRRETLAGMNGDQQITGIPLILNFDPSPMPQSSQDASPAPDGYSISIQDAFRRWGNKLDLHDLSRMNEDSTRLMHRFSSPSAAAFIGAK
jgi:hypothetical protein